MVESARRALEGEKGGVLKSLVILMIEEEQLEGLSARKLIVETVKHNVLTAYHPESGLDLLQRFPNVDAVFVHARLLPKRPLLLSEIKSVAPTVPIILASPGASLQSSEATWIIDSHKPQALLTVLAEGFGSDLSN
jgi:hypothetical protein